MDLGAAVDEIYAAPLAEFVAVRTRLVTRAKGEAPELVGELKALRKPTIVAWLLNRVAREESTVVSDLLDLGERMRAAQAKGDGTTLAAARPERREAIEALVAAARRCAEATGTTFGDSAADGVASTAVAALADPASGEALASGRLLRPLAYAGFGEVELDDAVAVLRLVPPLRERGDEDDECSVTTDEEEPERAERDSVESGDAENAEDAEDRREQERRREQEHALAQARDELRENERELSAARLAHSEAAALLEAAAEEVERLEAEVTAAAERVTEVETRPDAEPARKRRRGAGS